jgi:micrococcal nuclease
MGLLRTLIRAIIGGPRPDLPACQNSGDFARYDEARIRPAPFPNQPPFQRKKQSITGPCWVIDGDTVDIQGNRIRLAGIDAPELDQPYGKSAKWALVNLCKGQMVTAVFEEGSTYDRDVAICYLPDGRDLSAEMVKAGMAIDWRKFSGGKYRALELEGIRKKLWRCDARQKGRMPPVIPD